MGRYLGSWKLEDITYVTVQTSSVTTGAATDAETAPTWRMYEDNTATPVTTGSFSTLNAQAGFYVAAITLAAAIGYEKGKSYSLRVAATVGAVIGADVHSLQIEAEVDANAVSVTVNANPVALAAGAITAGTITDGAFSSSKFGAGFITAGSITDGALTSAKFGAGFITSGSFSAGAINAAAISDGALTSSKFGAGFITAGSFSGNAISGMAVTVGATAVAAIAAAVTANSIGPVTVNSTAQAAIVDLVWDEPKSGHTTADTYGEYLDATISGISGGSADTTLSPTAQSALIDGIWGATRAAHSTAGTFGEGVASVQGNITGSVASVTNGVTVGATAASAIAAQVTAGSIGPITVNATSRAAFAAAVWDEPKASHTTADTYGEYLDSTTAAIKADTAAIKTQTDNLTFTTLNCIKADVKFVNGVSVTGNGQSGTEWGPGS